MANTRTTIPPLPRGPGPRHTGGQDFRLRSDMTRLRDLIRREPRRGLALPHWIDRLVSVGIVSRDPQIVRRQRCVNAAAYASVVSGLSYVLITLLYDARGLWPLNIYNV